MQHRKLSTNRALWAGVFLAGCALIGQTAYTQGNQKAQIVQVRIDGKSAGFGFVIDGKTYVPLRNVTEGFGCTVEYDSVSQVVSISRPESTPATSSVPSEPIIRFSGSTSRKTEPFRITSKRWKITWKHKSERERSYFGISLYRTSDGRRVDMIANTLKAEGETSHQYTPGEFYLDISASEEYEIVIEQE